MPQFTLRRIPTALWDRVKARAATEHPPGQSFGFETKILAFLDAYARLGWRELAGRLRAPAHFDQHQADDPHCTCNDCMDAFIPPGR